MVCVIDKELQRYLDAKIPRVRRWTALTREQALDKLKTMTGISKIIFAQFLKKHGWL